jgi:hypothetical protein
MSMKRFLILSILVVFLTVSCAGPTVYRQAEWVMSPEEFGKDWKECSESIDENLNPEAFGKAIEECLEKKGYDYGTSQNAVRRSRPTVYGETALMKSQDEFEKDRKECIDSIDKNLNPEAFGKALEECMSKKGYQFKIVEKAEEPPSGNKDTAKDIALIALGIVLIPLAVAYGIWLIGCAP